MQQDNPKWIALCALEINYFPGPLYAAAIFYSVELLDFINVG